MKTGMVAATVTGNTLTLVSGGQTITLPLNANVLFFREGAQITASGLQLGDIVSTRSYNNGVSFVEVTQPVGTTGTPTNYDRVESGTMAFPISNNVLLINTNNQVKGLPLNSNAVVYRNGALTNLAALQTGDIVTTYAYNNYVVVIEVTKSVAEVTTSGEMTGTVVGPVANNQLTLTSSGQSYHLQLHANTFLYLNGAANPAGILLPGDVIKVHYYNGLVLYAEVIQRADGTTSTQPTISERTGTIISASNNVFILVIGNQAQAITLNEKAFVYRGGALVSGSALQAGDLVKVRTYPGCRS